MVMEHDTAHQATIGEAVAEIHLSGFHLSAPLSGFARLESGTAVHGL